VSCTATGCTATPCRGAAASIPPLRLSQAPARPAARGHGRAGDLETWQSSIPAALTCCRAAQLHRARYGLAGLQGVLGHYGTRTQRRWRWGWGCCIGKKQCISDVVRSLTNLDGRPREEVVIGFGAASGGGDAGGAISFKPGRLPINQGPDPGAVPVRAGVYGGRVLLEAPVSNPALRS
jgi:hypothetical protein